MNLEKQKKNVYHQENNGNYCTANTHNEKTKIKGRAKNFDQIKKSFDSFLCSLLSLFFIQIPLWYLSGSQISSNYCGPVRMV